MIRAAVSAHAISMKSPYSIRKGRAATFPRVHEFSRILPSSCRLLMKCIDSVPRGRLSRLNAVSVLIALLVTSFPCSDARITRAQMNLSRHEEKRAAEADRGEFHIPPDSGIPGISIICESISLLPLLRSSSFRNANPFRIPLPPNSDYRIC